MNIVIDRYVKNKYVVGLTLCNDIALGKKSWEDLFEPVSFFSMYKYVYSWITSQHTCASCLQQTLHGHYSHCKIKGTFS